MSRRPRCPKCEHRPGVRRITATVQTGRKSAAAEPRVRKKPCLCSCHIDSQIASVESQPPAALEVRRGGQYTAGAVRPPTTEGDEG